MASSLPEKVHKFTQLRVGNLTSNLIDYVSNGSKSLFAYYAWEYFAEKNSKANINNLL